MVPGINILADWRARVQESVPELTEKIEIRTYAYMCRHYTEFPADYYNYIVVDEAHHAVAPMLKRVIQYYEADLRLDLPQRISVRIRKTGNSFRNILHFVILKRSHGKRNRCPGKCLQDRNKY